MEHRLKIRSAAVLAFMVAWWPAVAAGFDWSKAEFTLRVDSVVSMSASMRTQGRDCEQIATINGGCNPFASPDDIAANDGDALTAEGTLINGDDGNLNWDQFDWFSVLVKGTHDVQADWRNYGAFVRFSWFADAVQVQPDQTRRTDLAESARFRDSVVLGGVVGAHFLLLDAYLDGNWEIAERYFNARVGNQVINWGESLFAQGGINSVNVLDVTKIRLPGSELKEALLPAPIVKVGGDIIPNLGFELYYQFHWQPFQLDPVGTFFASSDMVSRGAEGQFQPLPDQFGIPIAPGCGDPGTPEENRTLSAVCPPNPTLRNLTSFPNGVPFLGFENANHQGQLGAALRYYLDPIETELSVYYVRLHEKFPSVSHSGVDSSLAGCLAFNASPDGPLPPQAGCDIGYNVIYPEAINLIGFSFNTLLGDIAIGGELSYRPNQPQAVTFNNEFCNDGNPAACAGAGSTQKLANVNSLIESTGLNPFVTDGVFQACAGAVPVGIGCGGGVVPGFTRLDRIVGILNALTVVSAGTPYVGWIPRYTRANDMTFVAEFAVTNFPSLDQCPFGVEGAGLQAYSGCKRYPTPFGVDEVDDTGVGYGLRVSFTYDRIFGTPITFLPTVAFSHNVHGNTPPNEAGFTQGAMSLGIILEFDYLQRWRGSVSYNNNFGGGIRNGDADRDFMGLSIQYQF